MAKDTPISNFNHGLRRQMIVEALLADVFQGRLRAGERLVTQELAERFGVSHTPIREALTTLAGIGIVDLVPNRGAAARRITAHEVREICEVRRVLECAATRSACGRIERTALHALTVDLRRLMTAKESSAPSIEEARALDSRLHDLIVKSCGNTFLGKEISRLQFLFRAFRDVAWAQDERRHDYHRLAVESREHLAIVNALLDGNPKEASRAMARHIRSGAKYWIGKLPNSASAAPEANSESRALKEGRKQVRQGSRPPEKQVFDQANIL
jgi:DNA-binding GntR family transcriptional regulator